ncbi:MAG TPA: DoxX family protein [Balneolaceae bacterium]|nr:DoxX family protein [Balneolaceae bacterium]
MANRLKSSKSTAIINSSVGLFLLRAVPAALLIYGHGFGKVWNVVHGQFHFVNPIGIGPAASLVLSGFAEGICSFFVILGLYTRLAALILMINFVVAYFTMYRELAFLYLAVFTAVFLLGPGNFSFDRLFE